MNRSRFRFFGLIVLIFNFWLAELVYARPLGRTQGRSQNCAFRAVRAQLNQGQVRLQFLSSRTRRWQYGSAPVDYALFIRMRTNVANNDSTDGINAPGAATRFKARGILAELLSGVNNAGTNAGGGTATGGTRSASSPIRRCISTSIRNELRALWSASVNPKRFRTAMGGNDGVN